MYIIKRSLLVSLWFVFLTLPLLAVKVDTTNQTLVWRWENMLYVGIGAFTLYLLWMLAIRYRSRQHRREEVALPTTSELYTAITDNKKIVLIVNSLLIAVMLLMPHITSAYQVNIMTTALIYVILGLGLIVAVGFAGQLVLG